MLGVDELEVREEVVEVAELQSLIKSGQTFL